VGWLLLATTLSAGCRTTASAQGSHGLEVTELSVTFPEPGSGRLHFVVPQAPEDVTAVRWSLWLDGRLFATGLEGQASRMPGALAVDTPLVWRHLGWRDGARFVAVRVEGALTVGTDVALPFGGTHEVLVQGSPMLDSAED